MATQIGMLTTDKESDELVADLVDVGTTRSAAVSVSKSIVFRLKKVLCKKSEVVVTKVD